MRSTTLLLLAFASLAAADPDPSVSPISPTEERALPLHPHLRDLEQRTRILRTRLSEVDSVFRARVLPVEAMLHAFSDDSAHVRRIALALVREADAVNVSPGLLTSVLLVENPWLDPTAKSFVGAVGLMQVMPFHAGRWGCADDSLEAIEANVCHGSRILAHLLSRSGGDLERALLRYNGCVHGRNTPDCHEYPSKVFARAGRALMRTWSLPSKPTDSLETT